MEETLFCEKCGSSYISGVPAREGLCPACASMQISGEFFVSLLKGEHSGELIHELIRGAFEKAQDKKNEGE